MKKVLSLIVFVFAAVTLWSQGSVGINTGTDGPHESAILDIVSTNKALKLPRANPANIVNPVVGLLTHYQGITYQYTGSEWKPILTDEDLLWETMYDYIRAKDSEKAVVVGGDLPISNAKLTVRNINDSQTGAIYATSDSSTAIVGITGGHNALAGIVGTNNSTASSGYGGAFKSKSVSGAGVFGHSENVLGTTSVGGLFISAGTFGIGVKGEASNTDGLTAYGGYFENMGSMGAGVYASVENSSASANSYGGYFNNNSANGKGIYVTTLSTAGNYNDAGVFISRGKFSNGTNATTAGSHGAGVRGVAGDNGYLSSNYGGHFTTNGGRGVGVYGLANSSADEINYGGYFKANGRYGKAVYGFGDNETAALNYGGSFKCNAISGRGVQGVTTGITARAVVGYAEGTSSTTNYGGYFDSNGTSGRGVYGYASNSDATVSYGGYFQSDGTEGRGVFASAPDATASVNYGGYFEAAGISGKGALGRSTGVAGTGVVGVATGNSGTGTVGETTGANSKAVWGISHSLTGDTYSGYFTTNSEDGTGIYTRGKKYGARIDGHVKISSYSNLTKTRLSLYETNDFGFQFEYDGAEDKLHLWSKKFSGNEAKRMTWMKNGNIGIGTETPDHALDMEKGNNQVFRMKSTNGSSDILMDGTSGSNAIEFLENGTFKSSMGWSVANQRFFIYQAGNALVVKDGNVGIKKENPTNSLELPNNSVTGVARAFEWIDYSDKRIKKEVKRIPYGLETICQLEPKSYNQHTSRFENKELVLEDGYKTTLGLLAQDVYQIIPEIVYKPADDTADLWSMNYQKIIPVLIQAIKDQNEIIKRQEKELKKADRDAKVVSDIQEARITALEAVLLKSN